MEKYILKFNQIGIKDSSKVGGKNASLGEMYNKLIPQGIRVPNGFAITTTAYKDFINYNSLNAPLDELMKLLDKKDFMNLNIIGRPLNLLSHFLIYGKEAGNTELVRLNTTLVKS